MTGHIVLEGGAEFGGAMREPDLRAIELAGGMDAPIRIIPTAAAPDDNHARAGNNGRRWFTSLGATDVEVVPLTDEASAAAAGVAEVLRQARLIYLLGGFTHYLGETLLDSAAWNACLEAYADGAVIVGSSAGAMVLCEWYHSPREGDVEQGLGLVPGCIVLPHHNTFGHRWVSRLTELMPQATLLGIDERTGMVGDDPDGGWTVCGKGEVVLYHHGAVERHVEGDSFRL
jgi:cyanophycinase